METNARGSLKNAAAAACLLILLAWAVIPSRRPSQAFSAAPRRIPVYYWHMWSGEWQPVMDRVCAEFNASQTRYEVIPLLVPFGQGDQKFLLSVAGGDPPDVMAQWTPAIGAWAQAGILEPLDTRMNAEERRCYLHDTFPVVHQNGWYRGRLYGMLINFDVYACYYRRDYFRAAGLNPDRFPNTLEGLTADGARMNLSDSSGRLLRVGYLPTRLTNYAGSFGGGFGVDATGRVAIDTPQNLRALDFIVQAHRDLGFDRIIRFDAGLGADNGSNWPFIAGQMAVDLDGEWRVQQLAQYAPHLDYGVAALPPPAGGVGDATYSVASYLTIPAGARHPQGAWEFIKFWNGLDDPARGAKYRTWFGWLPHSQRMAEAPVYRAYLARYPRYRVFVKLAASPHVVTLPSVPYSVFLQDEIANDDDLAERGAASPRSALSLIDSQVRQEVAQRRELGFDQ